MKLQGWPSASRKQWRRVCPTRLRHWRRVDPRAAADRPEHHLDLALLRLLFPSAPLVRSNVTCKEEKTQAKFQFFLPLFRSALLLFFSLSPGLIFFCLLSSSGGRSGDCLGGGGRGGGQICQCLRVSAWRRKCFLGAGSCCGSVGTAVCWLLLEAGSVELLLRCCW